MAVRPFDSVLGYLRRLTPDRPDEADGELLARFQAGEPAAFEALVRRHAALVWGVCKRALPHSADAEDAFQATFLVLVRKAHGLDARRPLGPWLHRVAWRTACKARARAARLACRTRSSAAAPEPCAPEEQGVLGAELKAVLDEVVNQLPERYRLPVLLCYLEGLTNEEAARRLGCPKGTILSRLSRARDQLRQKLARRGLDLSGGALGGLVAHEGVPPPLVQAALRTASGAAPASVLTLAKGVLLSMTLRKLELAGLALLTLIVTASGAGLLATRTSAAPPATPAAVPAAPDRPAPPAAGGAAAKPPDQGSIARGKEREEPPDAPQKIAAQLSRTILFGGIEDPKTTLDEALDQMSKRYDLSFDIDARAFKQQGVEVDTVRSAAVAAGKPIPAGRMALGTALKRVLERIPTKDPTYLIRRDHIEITTADAVRQELGLPPAPEGKEGTLSERLPPLVQEEFSKVPLARALEQLADAADASVVVDARVEEKAGAAKVSARFRNVPLETALGVLADMAGLEVVRLENVYYVTSAENAPRLREARGKGRTMPPAR